MINNFISANEFNDLFIAYSISPEQFESTLNTLLLKVYQDGYDNALRDSVKAISRLTPNDL